MMKRHGFTLIELLVVIAIIALLVSILLPSLKTAQDLARRSACAAQLKSMGMGMHLYANEANGYVIPQNLYYSTVVLNANINRDTQMGLGVLMWMGYTEFGGTFLCPSDQSRGYQGLKAYNTGNTVTNGSAVMTSYTMQPTKTGYTTLHTIRPEAIVTLADPPTMPRNRSYPYAYISDFFDQRDVPAWDYWRHPRSHDMGYNVVYIDAHVKFVSDGGDDALDPSLNALGQFCNSGQITYEPWAYFENN